MSFEYLYPPLEIMTKGLQKLLTVEDVSVTLGESMTLREYDLHERSLMD